MANIDRWLKHMVDVGGTALHCVAGLPPHMRVAGALSPLEGAGTTAQIEIDGMLRYVASEAVQDRHERGADVDFVFELPTGGRFRAHAYTHHLGAALVFRTIPALLTVAELGLPAVMGGVARVSRGLVLVAGPPSSGKTCTVAAFVQELNRTRSLRISTVEDAITQIHEDRLATVTQREVGPHTASAAAGLRAASRDSEVVVIDELRDPDGIRQALLAAEAGRLVIAALRATDVRSAIERVCMAFPPEHHQQTRRRVAASYMMVTAQRMLPAADRRGQVPAAEVLLRSRVAANAIREDDYDTLEAVMERGEGSQTMKQALRALASCGLVHQEDAQEQAREAGRAESPRRG